jgi:hypothetical protein
VHSSAANTFFFAFLIQNHPKVPRFDVSIQPRLEPSHEMNGLFVTRLEHTS